MLYSRTRHKLFVLKFNRDLIQFHSPCYKTIEKKSICKMRLKRFLAYNLTDVFCHVHPVVECKIVLARKKSREKRRRKTMSKTEKKRN